VSSRLNKLLKNPPGKILFVGIGNVLKSDDGVGVYICNRIISSNYISKLIVEVSIENYIGKINKSGASLLILTDCVDLGKNPGYWDLLPAEKLIDLTFHTHNISLKKISELFNMPVWILGIQPGNTSFGEELTPEIKNTAENILKLINQKNI
jgi:hydrogenase 3 maturation protease